MSQHGSQGISDGLASAGCQMMLICRNSQAARALIWPLPYRQGINAQEGNLSPLVRIRVTIQAMGSLPPFHLAAGHAIHQKIG